MLTKTKIALAAAFILGGGSAATAGNIIEWAVLAACIWQILVFLLVLTSRPLGS